VMIGNKAVLLLSWAVDCGIGFVEINV